MPTFHDLRNIPAILPVIGAVLIIAVMMPGCAQLQKYHPAPLAAAATAANLETRSLADPGLKSFVEQSLGNSAVWPPNSGTCAC
jgi:hypothetical protein